MPHLGKYPLAKLTAEQVQGMLNSLLASDGADGAPLSARTVQYARAVLRRALNQALKWGIVMLLKLNSDWIVQARRLWLIAGVHPPLGELQ